MGVRLHDPNLGRFLQEDPVEGGSANDYDYASGDPVNNFDLDGMRCWTGKNPNGTCRSISRGAGNNARGVASGVGRGARWVYRHTEIGVSVCVVRCVGIGTQGGTIYSQTGWGCCYHSAGRVVATRVATDATWSCTTYDLRGRATSSADSAGRRTDVAYALDGQVTTSGPDSADTVRTTVATVDWLGRAASYTDEAGTTTSTAYDAYGRPQQIRRAFAGGAEALLTEVAAFHAASRVATLVDYAFGGPRTHGFEYLADGPRGPPPGPTGW